MVSVRKELWYGISIPIVFTAGIIAYILLIPSAHQTLGDFISYFSSLSTIVMVLVVVVTTSLQLREMQSARLLQTQPFPEVTPLKKSHIEELSFFYDYPHSKTVLGRRLIFFFNVENIGNAPIIAVDIIPKLTYFDEKGRTMTVRRLWLRIDSLKPNEKKEMGVMFMPETGNELDLADSMLRRFLTVEAPCESNIASPYVELIVLYKNILGANFRQRIVFDLFFYEEDEERIKSSIKLSETARIDYAEKMKRMDLLVKSDRDKATKLLDGLNKELSKSDGRKEINFQGVSKYGVFSVSPISEKEYQKQMQTRRYGHVVYLKPRQNQDEEKNGEVESKQ